MIAAATLAVLLLSVGLASWVVVRFLRRRYREAACLDGIDMEEIVEELEAAAERLREAQVDMAVMDCIGYTKAMRQRVRTKLHRPVLLASTLLARVAAELLE